MINRGFVTGFVASLICASLSEAAESFALAQAAGNCPLSSRTFDAEFTLLTTSRLESGAPVEAIVSGEAFVDLHDDDTAKVQMVIANGVAGSEVSQSEFELDVCTDILGVSCPMAKGTRFRGVAMWHSLNSDQVSKWTMTKTPQVFPSCYPVTIRMTSHVMAWRAGEVLHEADACTPAIDSSLLRAIETHPRKTDVGWTHEYPERFRGYSIADARRVTGGTVMRGHRHFEELPRRRYDVSRADVPVSADEKYTGRRKDDVETAQSRRLKSESGQEEEGIERYSLVGSIPASFDAREAFPECAEIIGRIRDQSDCGSCWAFASTEAFNDRRCIAAIGTEVDEDDQTAVLSAEDTTACCHGFSCGLSMGCNGGQPGSAWKWFTRKGVVTGGDYEDMGSGTTCKPYEFQPCAHHVDPTASGYPECPDGEYPTPECLSECSDYAYVKMYSEDKRKASQAYSLRTIEDIQRDMLKYGSVTAAFTVYGDFLTYAGGVYEHLTGSWMGGHAVKIIGWGTDEDSGKDYWLVANSWNPSWGEDGFFRILRGVNECGIEGQIVAGEA